MSRIYKNQFRQNGTGVCNIDRRKLAIYKAAIVEFNDSNFTIDEQPLEHTNGHLVDSEYFYSLHYNGVDCDLNKFWDIIRTHLDNMKD